MKMLSVGLALGASALPGRASAASTSLVQTISAPGWNVSATGEVPASPTCDHSAGVMSRSASPPERLQTMPRGWSACERR